MPFAEYNIFQFATQPFIADMRLAVTAEPKIAFTL
jgi:hypothetical protein